MVSFVIIIKLAHKYTKKFVYSLGNGMMALILPLMYLLDKIPLHWITVHVFGASVRLPVTWGYIVFFLTGFPVAVLMCISLPILADIADYDAKLHGKRREAIFFGAQGFLQKYAIALTFLIQGFLFGRYGFSQEHNMGVKLLGPVTGFFVLIGLLIFLFYPLNERTMELDDTPAARFTRALFKRK